MVQCTPILDVFRSRWRLPEKVCIVAPGPNGRGSYGRIPRDYLVLAVSKAVLIPEVHASVWLMNHIHQGWYPEASRHFRGIRIYGHTAAQEAELEMRQRAELGEKIECYSFTPPSEQLAVNTVLSVDGFIRVGASVSGCAIQLAYNFGAKDLLLCGVDMSGDQYFDGTANVQVSHGDTWPAVLRLNPLIRWMVLERGLQIRTLTPTRLDAPLYEQSTAALT